MRIDRFNSGIEAVFPRTPSVPISCFAAADAGRDSISESDFTKTMRQILKLALELDAIEQEFRQGSLSGVTFVGRCLSVLCEINKLDGASDPADPRA